MSAEGPGAIVTTVAFELRAALFPLMRRLQARCDDEDLTVAQSTALSRLDRFGPATPASLAAKEYVHPQSMATILSQLQRRGLVTRARSTSDGRSVTVSISEVGRNVLEAERQKRVRLLSRAMYEGFTADELRTLDAAIPLLRRLTDLV